MELTSTFMSVSLIVFLTGTFLLVSLFQIKDITADTNSDFFMNNNLYVNSINIIYISDSSSDVNQIISDGNNLYLQNDYTGAIKYYEKALGIDPKNIQVLSSIASCWAKSSDYDKAIYYEKQLLVIDSQNVFELARTGYDYYSLHKYAKAITYFEKALEIDPSNTVAQTGDYFASVYFIEQSPLKQIKVNNTNFTIKYGITGGNVTSMSVNPESKSLIVSTQTDHFSVLTMHLPRGLIDARSNDLDKSFGVLVDGKDQSYLGINQTSYNDERVLSIQYSGNTEKIEIFGTQIVPEFGPVSILVLGIIFVTMMLIYKTKISNLASFSRD